MLGFTIKFILLGGVYGMSLIEVKDIYKIYNPG